MSSCRDGRNWGKDCMQNLVCWACMLPCVVNGCTRCQEAPHDIQFAALSWGSRPPWKPVSRSLSFSPPLPGHALPCYPGVLPAPSISTVFLLLPIKLALYCDPCLHTCRVCLSRIWLGHDCAVENRMKCQTPRVDSQLASKTENGYLFSPFEGCL